MNSSVQPAQHLEMYAGPDISSYGAAWGRRKHDWSRLVGRPLRGKGRRLLPTTRRTIDELMEPVLELTNATLIRGTTRVFESLSLTIAHGEHTAVLGPNGAGKSSFIRMLTLDDRPRATDNGTPPLRLFGRSSWDLSELRTRLGVVTGDLDAGFGIGTSGGRVRGLDVALSGLLASHGVFSHHDVTNAMRDRARAALDRVEASHLAAEAAQRTVRGRTATRADRPRADHDARGPRPRRTYRRA